jgi:hypothetical protein
MTTNVLDLKADRTPAPPALLPEPSLAAPSGEPSDAEEESMNDATELDALLAGTLGPDELSWDAHAPYSGVAHKRRKLLAWGLVGAGLLTAALQASWSTGLVVLAGVGAWILHGRIAAPSKVHLNQRGCTIDGHHIPHAHLASFDIHEMRDGSVHLSLRTTARLSRYIHIPLGNQNPDEVHALLSRFVPEETHPVPLWESWMRKA